MNKQAFIDTANAILAADRFNLGTWTNSLKFDKTDLDLPVKIWEDCGTTGCVAGWAVAAKWDKIPNKFWTVGEVDWSRAGAAALGINQTQADRLFLFNNRSVWFTDGYRVGIEVLDTHGYRRIVPEDVTATQAAQMLLEIVNGTVTL